MDAIFAALEALKDSSPPAEQRVAATPPPQPAPPVAKPVSPPAQAQPVQHPRPPRAAGLLQGMFEDGNSLLRAVIAADVLNPPLALREPAHWNPQPNEPLT